MPQHRGKTVVQAFNLVPVVEHVLPDRPKTEVSEQFSTPKLLQGLSIILPRSQSVRDLHIKIHYQARSTHVHMGIHT